jgi:8-oxo-dGTP pyrophosphatase MutT (NUDIX family)
MPSNIYFIYNQKIVVLSKDFKNVLLAKRQGEADYDETYTFIGGKMETTDESLIAGMKREKDEEISINVTIKVLPNESYNVLYRKKDGDSVVVAHIPAVFVSGEITLNEEYSDYKWVDISKLDGFEPKVGNIPAITLWAKTKLAANDPGLVEI